MEPFQINQMGIARTFQNIRLFPNLTVLDNVRIAYHPHAGYGLLDGIFHNARFETKEQRIDRKSPGFPRGVQPARPPGRDRQEPALRRAAPPGDRPRPGRRTPACSSWMNPPPA